MIKGNEGDRVKEKEARRVMEGMVRKLLPVCMLLNANGFNLGTVVNPESGQEEIALLERKADKNGMASLIPLKSVLKFIKVAMSDELVADIASTEIVSMVGTLLEKEPSLMEDFTEMLNFNGVVN